VSLFSLSWTWIVLAVALIALLAFNVTHPRQPRHLSQKHLSRVEWHVEVKPAKQWVEVFQGHYGVGAARIAVAETVHVRMVGPDASLLIATVSLADDDYEELLTSAVAKAEERVSTLRALGVGT
jgi:hypothetical protein